MLLVLSDRLLNKILLSVSKALVKSIFDEVLPLVRQEASFIGDLVVDIKVSIKLVDAGVKLDMSSALLGLAV